MITDTPFATASIVLTQTLLHFLWQGAVLGLIAATATFLLHKRRTANAWYASQLCILAMMLLCPVVTLLVIAGNRVEPVRSPSATLLPETSASSPAMLPLTERSEIPTERAESLPAIGAASRDTDKAPAVSQPPATDPAPQQPSAVRLNLTALAPYVAAVYFAGVLLLLLRLAAGLHGGRRLQRASTPVTDPSLLEALARQAEALGLKFTPALAYCGRVAVPTIVGVVRPVILLPLRIQTGFTNEQIEMLLLHELAHLRRYDHLVNLVQRIAEALLFFHPAIWYVSRQISEAREHCCDDLVLASGGRAGAYAELLIRAGELAEPAARTAVAELHAANGPSRLRRRIARILGADIPIKLSRAGFAGLLATLLIAVSTLAVMAASQDTGEQSTTTADESPVETSEPQDEPPIETDVPGVEPAPETEPVQLAQRTPEPRGANGQLLEQLNSGDPWVSKIAARKMGESGGHPFYIDDLIRVLVDEDRPQEVRAACAEALGAIGDPQAVPYLVSALRHHYQQGSPQITDAAVKALATIDDPSVIETLTLAVDDGDVNLRAGAYRALARIRSPEAVDLLIERGLGDAGVGAIAPNEIAELASDERVLNKLIAALDSDDEPRAQGAMRALAVAGTDEAKQAIVEALHSRQVIPDATTIDPFLTGLIDDPDVLNAMAGLLYDGLITDGRERVADAINRLGLVPEDPEKRAALTVAARNYEVAPTFGEAAVEPLIRALVYEYNRNPSGTNMLIGVIRALGQIGDPKAVQALQPYFDHNSNHVAQSSVDAVGQIGTPEAVPALISALTSPHPGARETAAEHLGELHAESAVEPLIASLRDLHPGVRRSASRALGKIGDPAAVPALIEALQDPDTRTWSVWALGEIGDQRAIEPLKRVRDKDAGLLAEVDSALKKIGAEP